MSRDASGDLPTGEAAGEPGLTDRVRHTVRWAVGTSLALARYPFQRVPSYRRDHLGDHHADRPDPDRELPGDPATVQRARDGVGPLYHRRYWVGVADSELDPTELMDVVASDLNAVTPTGISRFESLDGRDLEGLEAGDELVVRLPGPWEGPIRVVERTPASFRFVTLVGHMEAGEIVFRADIVQGGSLRFEIESWARSSTRQFRVLYDLVPVARETQLQMWSRFCTAVARRSGGVLTSDVQVHTCRPNVAGTP